MKWKTLHSSYKLKNEWLTVRKDHVRMPSGHEMDDFYIVEYPDWVNVIAITEQGLFIIEEQYRHGLRGIYYELCAGVSEKGETPLQAAKRELMEETGFSGGEWTKYMISAPNSCSNTNICTTFLAIGVKKENNPILEESEDIKIHLFSKEHVYQALLESKIIEGVMQAPLWRYLSK